MLKAANEGKDLYASVAARAFHTTYEECLEHFPKDTPIICDNKNWRYATKDEIKNKIYTKLADGETDVYSSGKERRKQAKVILLGLMYGRGPAALAEQLNCDTQEAISIMNSVYNAFPGIRQFEIEQKEKAHKLGYSETIWGRRRRLDDILLDKYEFIFTDIYNDNSTNSVNKRKQIIKEYTDKLDKSFFKDRSKIIDSLWNTFHVKVKDNSSFIARANRQIINAIIQGSAADMSKKALIKINEDAELKELGFQMLVPIHDEILAQCPLSNVKRCKELFTHDMETCAEDRVPLDIKVDPTCSFAWYGEEVDLDNIKETTKNKINLNEKVEIDLTDNAFDEIFADEENENEEEK